MNDQSAYIETTYTLTYVFKLWLVWSFSPDVSSQLLYIVTETREYLDQSLGFSTALTSH